jgi:hypothetical protein
MSFLVKYDFTFFYFSQSSETCIFCSSWDIFKFSKVIESLIHALFANFCEQFSSNKIFLPKTRCDWVYFGNFSLFLCVCNTESSPHPYLPHPPTATVKLAFFGLELKSFSYWTSTQTGNYRIDKWLLSKYGRVQSAPMTSSEASLISMMSSVYRGPIRPLAVGWAASQGQWGKGLSTLKGRNNVQTGQLVLR